MRYKEIEQGNNKQSKATEPEKWSTELNLSGARAGEGLRGGILRTPVEGKQQSWWGVCGAGRMHEVLSLTAQ